MTTQKSNWIPTAKQLPKRGELVLAQATGNPMLNIGFVDAMVLAEYDKNEGWIVDGYEQWVDPDIIAWMPLPEPYREPVEPIAYVGFD